MSVSIYHTHTHTQNLAAKPMIHVCDRERAAELNQVKENQHANHYYVTFWNEMFMLTEGVALST